VDEVIFVELLGRRGRAVQRTRIDTFPATLGRALTNEVVIDDVYVSPQHAHLAPGHDGKLYLEDLKSTNGIRRGHSRERVMRLSIESGDVVRMGHTLVRFRDPYGSVKDAVIDDFEHGPLRSALAAPSFAVLMGVFAITAMMFNTWLETFDRVKPEGLMADASYTLLFIAIWAGLWSLANRFGSREFDFVSHFSFACSIGILSLVLNAVAQYYEFLASPLRSMYFVEFCGEVSVLCMLLFGHLSIATRLRRLRRIGLTVLIVLPLAGLTELKDSALDATFDATIHFPSQLKPVPLSWVPSQTVTEFFEATKDLEAIVDALAEAGEGE